MTVDQYGKCDNNGSRCYANVVIPPLSQAYTYEVGQEHAATVRVGSYVQIPLGKRRAHGFVVEWPVPPPEGVSEAAIKKIHSLAVPYPLFLESQKEFFQWCGAYYADSLGRVLEVAIPPLVSEKTKKIVTLAKPNGPFPKGKGSERVIKELQGFGGEADLSALLAVYKGARPIVKKLAEAGVVTVRETELYQHHRSSLGKADWAPRMMTLNAPQEAAAQEICQATEASTFTTFLLHGVTGSGKTEVYIEAVRAALAAGKGAIILVPEIALTPQLIDRFHARLGPDLAVLHSGLQQRARWDAWRALLSGEIRVAIGARSAVFAPVHNLGLIIVDEEHDSSYKQGEGLRYQGRDLAIARAKLQSCPVVLGSATPSLESYHHAASGRYRLLSLPSRPNQTPAPSVKLIDLNHTKPWEMASPHISGEFSKALSDTLARGEQAFILYNRRGFARYLQCESCEFVVQCPHCSVTLTFHRSSRALLCHYCGLQRVAPDHCPHCAAEGDPPRIVPLVQRGAGTERVYDEVRELFPNATIDRLDRDAVEDLESYRAILERLRSQQTNILVGTQMIAKGHDLPNVTLVGVVDCDVGLHMPDFRSGERIFHLLTQAAGRAGRSTRAGFVILQTRVPKHPSIVHTLSGSYPAFARYEIETRRALRYPPFARLLRVIASAMLPELPLMYLNQLGNEMRDYVEKSNLALSVLGPTPAPLEKLKAQYRAHLLVKGGGPRDVLALVQRFKGQKLPDKRLRVVYDIDPQDMM